MKKVLAAVAVVCVVCVAGAAIAQPRTRDNDARRLPPQQMQQAQQPRQPQPGQPGPQMQQRQPGPQFNGAPCCYGYGEGPRGNWQQGGYCEPGRYCDPRQNYNQRRNNRGCNFDQRGPQGMPGEFDRRGPRGRGMMFAPDMPDEIRDVVVKVAKLRVDLDAALSQKPIDKAAALEAFTKIQKHEQEIEVWRFEKKLNQWEAFRTQQELNRKMPPARAPKADEKPEAQAPAQAPAPEAAAE